MPNNAAPAGETSAPLRKKPAGTSNEDVRAAPATVAALDRALALPQGLDVGAAGVMSPG